MFKRFRRHIKKFFFRVFLKLTRRPWNRVIHEHIVEAYNRKVINSYQMNELLGLFARRCWPELSPDEIVNGVKVSRKELQELISKWYSHYVAKGHKEARARALAKRKVQKIIHRKGKTREAYTGAEER